MTGDIAITGNIGYDWFQQWGTNDALGSEYAVGALPWNNYYTWIMMANNVISLIDETDIATLGAKERSYLGFAYAYRAMFYLDLVRLYEFKENAVTRADDLLGLGVPIVLPETTEAQAKNNPRATVDEIYDSVIFPDLEKAGKLLENFTAPDKYTISLALKLFCDQTSSSDYGALFAMSTLSLVPIFLIFAFMQKYLTEGVATSGIKG